LVKIREEVGEQITEDAPYGKDYIKWRKGDKGRRIKFRERAIGTKENFFIYIIFIYTSSIIYISIFIFIFIFVFFIFNFIYKLNSSKSKE
jgi:hypothetical protein